MLLSGKKVLISGGSRGIGAACAAECHKEGASVGILYNEHGEDASALADLIGSSGGEACALAGDVLDLPLLETAASEFSVWGRRRGIDGLVVNAGIYERAAFSDLDEDSWNRTIGVNLTGAYRTIKATVPHMRTGSIVIVSSQVAFRGSQNGADYASSKAGLLGLGRSLAIELAPDIRVNMVAPGFIATDILSADTLEKRRERNAQVPLGRVGRSDEVAMPIVFLLSEMASYITGATLDINGGLLIR
jgi:3-oxoacyl-[acyl-carrier protein] reductase